jgi:hypothetical protein
MFFASIISEIRLIVNPTAPAFDGTNMAIPPATPHQGRYYVIPILGREKMINTHSVDNAPVDDERNLTGSGRNPVLLLRANWRKHKPGILQQLMYWWPFEITKRANDQYSRLLIYDMGSWW